ncbi:MAG: hypothetical protein HZB36_05510 [Candidatus Omnitrophica bacterium]|nr:hypothetical protein [Candidatus Omnitrophota bacterium]
MFLSAIGTKRIGEAVDYILNRLLIVFFFCILVVYASREIADLDLWLHLKTGEYIIHHRFIPSADIFSFTIYGRPWINHEWFFQAFAYLFYASTGADGLILMQNIILITTFLFLFFSARRKNNHIFLFIVLYLTLLTCAYRFTIRPDIFSLFFLTVYLCLIKSFIERKTSFFPFALVLTICQIAWVNMHGFFFTGPLIILVFLFAEILKRTVKLPASWNQTRRIDNRQMLQLLIILGLIILASFINPYGLKGAAYPFSVLGQISGKGKIIFQYIQELARPITLKNIFDINFFPFYKAFILVSLFSFRFNQRHVNISDLAIWLLFTGFSFIAIRNVAYFAFAAAFVTFNNIELALENKKTLPGWFQNKRMRSIFCYLLLAFLFYSPFKGAQKYLDSATYDFDTYELKSGMLGVSHARFPQKAVDFLLKHDLPSHMLNDFNSGSYLIGRAFPKRQVFIDGRTELYGPDFFSRYVSLAEGKKDVIKETLEKYDIRGSFLTASTNDLHVGLTRYFLHNPAWTLVYFDEGAVIFLKDIPENKGLIKKFRIDLKTWEPPEPDFLKIGISLRYPMPYVYRARFLHRHGFYEAAAKEARVILDLMPNNGEAFKFLSDYYFENKDYKKAFIYARNCLLYTPGDLVQRAKLALIYHHLNDEDKALKVINAIIKKQPKFARAFYVKALILKKKNQKTAEELLRQASKLAPEEPRYHAELGDLLAQYRDPAGAKKEWQSAYEYDSSNEALIEKIGTK